MRINTELTSNIFSTVSNIVLSPTLMKYVPEHKLQYIRRAALTFQVVNLVKDVSRMVENTFTHTITIPDSVGARARSAIVSYANKNKLVETSDQHVGLTFVGLYPEVIPSPKSSIRFTHAGYKYSLKYVKKAIVYNTGWKLPSEPEDETSPGLFEDENRIVITCPSKKAAQEFIDKCQDLIESSYGGDEASSIYIRNVRYNEFRQHSYLRQRNMDTVILKPGQLERITEHIDDFIDSEEMYAKLGIPYKTGILLYGPPGTGKTSLVNALANHFSRSVYIISLSSLKNSEELFEIFGQVPSNSILLLEDIDLASDAASAMGNTHSGVTSSDLLNVIDGVMSPHGLITVMTTNNKDKIIPALLRPGRIDLQENITYLDTAQLVRLYETFVGPDAPKFPEFGIEMGLSPAAVVGVIRDNLKTPESTADGIFDLMVEM